MLIDLKVRSDRRSKVYSKPFRRLEETMNAGKICTLDVITCRSKASALEAAKLMRANHVGDLVVVDERDGLPRPVGLVTDRDIAVSIVAEEVDPATLLVADIMTSPPVTAFEWEDAGCLPSRMRLHGVRRVVIVDDAGELVGIVSLDDLLRAAGDFLVELGRVSARQQILEEKLRARRSITQASSF
jgi:CBS domain-containing protein